MYRVCAYETEIFIWKIHVHCMKAFIITIQCFDSSSSSYFIYTMHCYTTSLTRIEELCWVFETDCMVVEVI